ncbi:MAG: ABC transporter permease [Caldilineales bacterium]
MKAFTKIAAFFLKEFHDVRRQPRLLLSLVGGPLLVLAAFGATFRSANPGVSAVLVWPENGVPGVDQSRAEAFIGSSFMLAKTTSDRAEAMAMLDRGDVDVVQIVPDVSTWQAGSGQRPEIEVYSRTIDPTAEAWIRSLSYGELNFINQSLLTQEATAAQTSAKDVSVSLANARQQFDQFRQSFSPQDIGRAAAVAEDLKSVLSVFLALLPPLSDAQANLAPELYQLHSDVQVLVDEMEELGTVLKEEDLPSQIERLSSSVEEIDTLRGTVDVFVSVPPDTIISPVKETYSNLRGAPYSMVIFYTPAVLALLIQALGATLGSLGLVREQEMGSFEMFRVSPLRLVQILLGKAIAYVLYVTVAGVILTLLLALIGVPMPRAFPMQHLALIMLLATASVGIGLLISSLSHTDSQAIQMVMLLLLLSIFFTGFFLPITGFAWPAWIIAILLPMTHANIGFQELLLKGESLRPDIYGTLVFLSVLSYGMVCLIMWRKYHKTSG